MPNFQQSLRALQAAGKIPTRLPASSAAALERSLGNYGGDVSANAIEQLFDKMHEMLLSIANPQQVERDGKMVTEGHNPASATAELNNFAESLGAENIVQTGRIPFMLDVATNVMRGGARHVVQSTDRDILDASPAWELKRVYSRRVPRGEKVVKGQLVEDPGNDWPSRFRAAAIESGDDDALRILEETGRMIALKASPIWDSLGDGAGDYDDTLGNPFPPFAFNSGFDLDEVSRKVCEEIGLLEKGDEVPARDIDLSSLFAPIKEAA